MAPFNPPIQPTNDPNYESRSRPIDIPESIRPRGVEENRILPKGQEIGDKSAEYLGKASASASEAEGSATKGFGDLFAGIVGIGDFAAKAGVQVVKKDIEDRVYDIANKERMAYTEALETVKAGKAGRNILDANASMDETPSEVEGLPDTLGSLTGARDAGKISNSYYQARLLAEAKDLRARYPGFRQEIDDQFAKVTGVNPANAYINSLVGDINRATASGGKEKAAISSFILQRQGYPGFKELYGEYQAGNVTTAQVLAKAAPYERQEQDWKWRASEFNDVKLSRSEREFKANRGLDKLFQDSSTRAVDSILIDLKLNTPEDVISMSEALKVNKLTAQEWEAKGQGIKMMAVQLKASWIRDATKAGLVDVLGADEIEKRATAAVKNINDLGDMVYAKDSGTLYSTARSLKAQVEDDSRDMLSHPKIGPPMRQARVLQSYGDEFMKKFSLDMIKSGFPAHYQSYATGWMKEITTQSNIAKSGMPVVFNDVLEDFRDKGMDPKSADGAKINAKLMGMVDMIGDKSVPDAAKVNIANAAFSPANQGMISKLQADGFDAKGRPITGQSAIFQKWTSEDKTAEIKRLGETTPGLWRNYVNWAKSTLGNELIQREINDLKTIPDNANVKVRWDPDNSRFKAVDTRPDELKEVQRGYHVSAASNQYFKRVEASVERINNNMSGFKNIAKTSGEDVNAFMLSAISDAAGREALTKVEGIPFQMLQQMGLMKLRSGIGSK